MVCYIPGMEGCVSVPYGFDRTSNIGNVFGDVTNMEAMLVAGFERACVQIFINVARVQVVVRARGQRSTGTSR